LAGFVILAKREKQEVGVRRLEEEHEPVRLPVLALLAGYDPVASRAAGSATTVDRRRYSPADSALMNTASSLELHVARELRYAIVPVDLCQLLRLGVDSPGQDRFLAALVTLTKAGERCAGDMTHGEIDRLRMGQNEGVRAAFRAEVLPWLEGSVRADAETALCRIDDDAVTGPVPVRPEVVALLLDWLPLAGQDFHADGRPFTDAESRLAGSATEKEWNDAASLQDADAEIEGARLGRSLRLHQILASAPAHARLGFAADLDRHLPPPPDLAQSPLTGLIGYQDQFAAAFAAAFRKHVLPGLGPRIKAEAAALLAHLDRGSEL
jgi:hypothetical protein